jgi:hypothetical protein
VKKYLEVEAQVEVEKEFVIEVAVTIEAKVIHEKHVDTVKFFLLQEKDVVEVEVLKEGVVAEVDQETEVEVKVT